MGLGDGGGGGVLMCVGFLCLFREGVWGVMDLDRDTDRDTDRGAGVTGGGGDVLILLYFQTGSRWRVRRTRESKLYTSTYFFFLRLLPNNGIHLTVFQFFSSSSFLRKWILSVA